MAPCLQTAERTKSETRTCKYIVAKIVGHIASDRNIKEVIRLNGHSAKDDTIESLDFVPQHLIALFWSKKRDR